MQAEYEMKVPVIRSKDRAARLFANIPMLLTAAMAIQAGERVRWQRLGRSDLRLGPPGGPRPGQVHQKVTKAFSAESRLSRTAMPEVTLTR